MVNENKILEEVEKTLQSFDNDVVLEGNPFLLTRIKAAIGDRLHKRKKGFSFKVSFTKVIITLILLINAVTLVYYYDWNSQKTLQQKLVSELKTDFHIDQSQNNF
ncbi:hypothetical protein [Clostridium sp.]|uniref:hypothetical protein n=1 Tax=Clostridium sp. TaxID=1506 RepID=UPI0028499A32|nr:hypothetical protein [Clostridium sp.]MDR3593256.1 hypothetical protein [Clostridium sp.]